MIVLPGEDFALLNAPYPVGQCSVQDKVCDNRPQRQILGLVPSKLVVEAESDGGDDDRGVAQGQPNVGEEMRLLEFQGCEIVW